MTVYLVGAGPGDPGLLTVRGAEVLGRADVVVYDRLSVASLLELAPAGAERIPVGKAPGRVTLPQEDINALLVARGAAGETVVRLKGGDPFVFARGGEEARALLDAGVPFEVVPGISSAIAAPAYAGVPVTLRHSSTSFTVITGHEDPSGVGEVDWEAAARLGGTILVLMGVGRLAGIVARLRAGGLPGSTPVAVVRWGTRPEQTSVRATLDTVLEHELAAPAVIVIGQVAAEDLAWFERRPLFGRRVVVTRTRTQASALSTALREAGAEPFEVPVIRIAPPEDPGGLARAVAACRDGAYDWVVLTSPNGAERFCASLRDGRDLVGARLAAIGPGTAAVLRAHHLEPDLVPERFVAESLLDAMPDPGPAGGRVLLARAAVAREVLPDGLEARGWAVDVVPAYRTVPVEPDAAAAEAVAAADVVTFTSSSTVTHFVEAFGTAAVPPVVACIGPVTAATAHELGLEVAVTASTHTVPGLVEALVGHLGSGSD